MLHFFFFVFERRERYGRVEKGRGDGEMEMGIFGYSLAGERCCGKDDQSSKVGGLLGDTS